MTQKNAPQTHAERMDNLMNSAGYEISDEFRDALLAEFTSADSVETPDDRYSTEAFLEALQRAASHLSFEI